MAKTNPYDPEVMRKRFWELKPQLDALQVKMEPLRVEQDEIANYKRDREVAVNAELKKLNFEASDIATEMGVIVKALGGRTGEGPNQPYDAEAVARFHAENPVEQEAVAPAPEAVEGAVKEE